MTSVIMTTIKIQRVSIILFSIHTLTQLLAAHIMLYILQSEISYKWNHTVCPLLCPASFTQHNVFELFFCLFVCFSFIFGFIAAHGLSLVVVSGGYSSLQCRGFSLRWLLFLRSTGSRSPGFSSCSTRAQ